MAQTRPDLPLAWIALARSGGVGPALFERLRRRFGSPEQALRHLPELAAAGRIRNLRPLGLDEARRELEETAARGGRLLTLEESEYPERLLHLPDPPPLLACEGRTALAGLPAVAIVGARNASTHGRRLARDIAGELAACGVAVVSGLARGIDTAAHEGALEGGGSTIAVIACGLDVVYPPENGSLMREIATRGLVITEHPLGEPPRSRHFPRRNRLIAALSHAVLVVEAAERSGSLMTARLASELGREVLAVPGAPQDPRHRGTNRLLREGAALVESAEDILRVLESIGVPQHFAGAAGADVPLLRHRAVPAAPMPEEEPRLDGEGAASELAERLFRCLSPEAVSVDELVRQCQASAADVQEALLELEMQGRIEWHAGNRVSRSPS